jgi:hypothetical protein
MGLDSESERGLTDLVSTAAITTVIAAPAAIASIGRWRGRESLYLAGAGATMVGIVVWLTVPFLMLPPLAAAGLFLNAYLPSRPDGAQFQDLVLMIVVAVPLAVAMAVWLWAWGRSLHAVTMPEAGLTFLLVGISISSRRCPPPGVSARAGSDLLVLGQFRADPASDEVAILLQNVDQPHGDVGHRRSVEHPVSGAAAEHRRERQAEVVE